MPPDETLAGILITGKKIHILIWIVLENVQKCYNFLELGKHLFLPPT